jgi:hypothetical protein
MDMLASTIRDRTTYLINFDQFWNLQIFDTVTSRILPAAEL